MSDVAKVLAKAAEVVEAGWYQGELTVETPEGQLRCVLGAVCEARHELRGAGVIASICDANEALDLLAAVADEAGFGGVTTWNDAPGRTAEEVAAVLRELAKKEEGE